MSDASDTNTFGGLSEATLASRGINPFSGPRPVHPNVTFVRESLRAFPERAPDILAAAVRSTPEIGPQLVDAAIAACPEQRQPILDAARRLGALRLRTLASVFFAMILDRLLGVERHAKAHEAPSLDGEFRAPSGAALAPLGVMALLIGLDSAGVLSGQNLVATASAATLDTTTSSAEEDAAARAAARNNNHDAVFAEDVAFENGEEPALVRADDRGAMSEIAALVSPTFNDMVVLMHGAEASRAHAAGEAHGLATRGESLEVAVGGMGADRLADGTPSSDLGMAREGGTPIATPIDPLAEELGAFLSEWTAKHGLDLDGVKMGGLMPDLVRASQLAGEIPFAVWRAPDIPAWADTLAAHVAARTTWFETSGLRQAGQFLSFALANPGLAKGLDVAGLIDRIDGWVTIGTRGRYELKAAAIAGADDRDIADAVIEVADRAADWMRAAGARGIVSSTGQRFLSGLETQLPRGYKAGDAADAFDAIDAYRAWRESTDARIEALAHAVGGDADDDILAAFLSTPLSTLGLDAEDRAAAEAAGLDGDSPLAAYLAVLAAEQDAAVAAAEESQNPFAV